jgi:hypothetical protein
MTPTTGGQYSADADDGLNVPIFLASGLPTDIEQLLGNSRRQCPRITSCSAVGELPSNAGSVIFVADGTCGAPCRGSLRSWAEEVPAVAGHVEEDGEAAVGLLAC